MNIQNLGSQESVGVKYLGDIYHKFCLKLWFERDWYYCNITESRWFYMGSRKKVPNNHFVKSVQKQQYADVLQVSVLKNFTQVFSHEYCKKF